jgi:hypothetical protein
MCKDRGINMDFYKSGLSNDRSRARYFDSHQNPKMKTEPNNTMERMPTSSLIFDVMQHGPR